MPYCLTYVYVKISGSNFDLYDFCNKLNLDYSKIEPFYIECESIDLFRCESFTGDINDSVRETLAMLFGKESVLSELKEKYKLEYTLERVPVISNEDGYPYLRLSLDEDIIEFMYKTGMRDDLDYHIH